MNRVSFKFGVAKTPEIIPVEPDPDNAGAGKEMRDVAGVRL
jgi:hypothetical protein